MIDNSQIKALVSVVIHKPFTLSAEFAAVRPRFNDWQLSFRIPVQHQIAQCSSVCQFSDYRGNAPANKSQEKKGNAKAITDLTEQCNPSTTMPSAICRREGRINEGPDCNASERTLISKHRLFLDEQGHPRTVSYSGVDSQCSQGKTSLVAKDSFSALSLNESKSNWES
jgi:hypothetical protein